MNEKLMSYWDYSEPEELERINTAFKTTRYLNKWWVSDNFPFEVHRMIDEENSGALAFMKQYLLSYNGSNTSSVMQGTLKMLKLLETGYYQQYENAPMYDNQPIYNYKETATMVSNIKMVEHLKVEQTMIHNHDKDIQKQINSLTKKIKKYQEQYPERII